MLLFGLIVLLYIWGPNIQKINGKLVNVKKLEEEHKRKHPKKYNQFEYYCEIDPDFAERYDECWKTNFWKDENQNKNPWNAWLSSDKEVI